MFFWYLRSPRQNPESRKTVVCMCVCVYMRACVRACGEGGPEGTWLFHIHLPAKMAVKWKS